MSRKDDFVMCDSSFKTRYFEANRTMFQLDIRPFLTQCQIDNGSTLDWFSQKHFQELLMLLQPVITRSLKVTEPQLTKLPGQDKETKDCILTGDKVRVACTFKETLTSNTFLMQKPANVRRKKADINKNLKYKELVAHKEKVVVYVCPRASSSLVHLSQLVHQADRDSAQEDISKYFPSHGVEPGK